MKDLNLQNPKLNFNIALVGSFPDLEKQKNLIVQKIRRIISILYSECEKYAKGCNGYKEEAPTITFITSSILTQIELIEEIKKLNNNFNISCVLKENGSDPSRIKKVCDTISTLNLHNSSNVSMNRYIFSWIVDQADLALVLYDNTEDCRIEEDFLNYSRIKGLTAIKIDKSNPSYLFWTEKSCYDCYNDDKLKSYLNRTLSVSDSLALNSKENTQVFGYKLLWGNLYNRFMNKYKASVDTSKPFIKDSIMDREQKIKTNDTSEQTRNYYISWFYEYDSLANTYSGKYHSSIYLRAIIPLIVTIFLAIGFYTETLLSPWPVNIYGTSLSLWSLLAGLGFFVHALLNLYVFRLSQDSTIKSWHKSFINNRYIAEALRLAVHFIPFGIPLNVSENTIQSNSKKKKTEEVVSKLRSIINGISFPCIEFDDSIAKECLNYIEELVEDQMLYHERSVKRYDNICRSIKLMGKIVFYIGFLVVLLRGCLQLFISINGISGELNNIPIQSITKSLANMFALLLPSWAAYFSTKLGLCNFEGLLENHTSMQNNFTDIKQMINDEEVRDNISYTNIYDLSQNVISIIMGEVSEWYSQINSKTVTKL